MLYKKATEISPSLFKRQYGVSLKTFWKMVEVVRNAKLFKPWQPCQIVNSRPNSAGFTVLAGVQNLLSHSARLGNS
jgi:hypothetical protein